MFEVEVRAKVQLSDTQIVALFGAFTSALPAGSLQSVSVTVIPAPTTPPAPEHA